MLGYFMLGIVVGIAITVLFTIVADVRRMVKEIP